MSDITATIAIPPGATRILAAVPLSPAQLETVAFDAAIQLSFDGLNWIDGITGGYAGAPGMTSKTNSYTLGGGAVLIPLPAFARIVLRNASDPTLAPTLEAA